MEITVSTIGALIALMISIFLIFKKLHPAYSLMLGAIIGGLLGGGGLQGTTNLMIDGAKNIMPAVLRIISAGVLAGVLIESGAAVKISETIVQTIGDKNALIALSIATLVLTAVGVFIDVAVITVAPIALSIGAKSGFSKPSILLAMIGGGKAGKYNITKSQYYFSITKLRSIFNISYNFRDNSCNIWIYCNLHISKKSNKQGE